MEDIRKMKRRLETYAVQEVENKPMQEINTHELGDVVDMIKDLAEAEYYCRMAEMSRGNEGYGGGDFFRRPMSRDFNIDYHSTPMGYGSWVPEYPPYGYGATGSNSGSSGGNSSGSSSSSGGRGGYENEMMGHNYPGGRDMEYDQRNR